jgi:RNA recognition motif-containing protein
MRLRNVSVACVKGGGSLRQRHQCVWRTEWRAMEDVMLVKLFVGNLPWSVGDAELEDIFRDLGEVQSARVITDRDTGRSRGFGFVELEAGDAATVINATNGREIGGRALNVREADDRREGSGPRRRG